MNFLIIARSVRVIVAVMWDKWDAKIMPSEQGYHYLSNDPF